MPVMARATLMGTGNNNTAIKIINATVQYLQQEIYAKIKKFVDCRL